MEFSIVMLIVAVAIIALISYFWVWAFVTGYFVADGTTDELNVTKAVVAVILFGLLLVLLAWWARREAMGDGCCTY